VKESDRKLVEAIRDGDVRAFEELYRLYFRRIHNFAYSKIGNPAEAEDVTQEVFEAVFTCLDRFQGKSDLVVWIYGITRNILNNRLRRRATMRIIPLEDMPSEYSPVDAGPERRAVARETLERLQEVIESLPRDQRKILELRHSKRLAIRKIAKIMNRSEDAVKSSLYRTRRALAGKLPEEALELYTS
jgi:RNA polymerase sigma-70 factor (ECF subfamily)